MYMAEQPETEFEEYAFDFHCTYKQLDDDDLYRSQFLQAFKIESWNDKEITRKTDILFEKVGSHFSKVFEIFRKEETRFTHLMLFMGEALTDENLFRILFTMDLFQEAHLCFCEVISAGQISDTSMLALTKAVYQ